MEIFSRISQWSKSFYPPFYILAGLIAGPPVLGLVTDRDIIGLFGEIGVVFLLFYLGFEFSLNTLIKKRRSLITAGMIDFVVNFGIGFIIGKIIGLDLFSTIALAGIVYMSSSGIITKTLIQLNAINDPEGELIMGIMVFEDLVMVLFLIFITTFSKFTDGIEWTLLGRNIFIAISFCAVLVILGKKYYKYIDMIFKSESEEVINLSFLAIVFMVTAIGKQLGVSEALGAFFLGMAISRGENSKKIEKITVKFRDIFGSMFFFYFGMKVSLNNLNISMPIILIILVLVALGKIASSILISKVLKCSLKKGLFIGMVTVSRGEFSLLITEIIGNKGINFETLSVLLILFTSFISTGGFKLIDILCNKGYICLLPKELLGGENAE